MQPRSTFFFPLHPEEEPPIQTDTQTRATMPVSSWIAHVAAYRSAHSKQHAGAVMPWKDALVGASATYRGGGCGCASKKATARTARKAKKSPSLSQKQNKA
jgi:hypothetical protein